MAGRAVSIIPPPLSHIRVEAYLHLKLVFPSILVDVACMRFPFCVTWNIIDHHFFYVTTAVIFVFIECEGIGHGLWSAVAGHAVGVTVRPVPRPYLALYYRAIDIRVCALLSETRHNTHR
jgi:hypothetical protein